MTKGDRFKPMFDRLEKEYGKLSHREKIMVLDAFDYGHDVAIEKTMELLKK